MGNLYRYSRTFRKVDRAKYGGGADEFNNTLKYEGKNCYIPSGNGCFLTCINYIFKKIIKEFFEFIQSYKRRTNVRTGFRITEFCGIYKIDF